MAAMTTDLVIEVEPRESTGKGPAKVLRRQGLVPAVVYGGKIDALPITVEAKAIGELLKGEAGSNAIFSLRLAGTDQEGHAMIKDLDVHPLTRQMVHVDFLRITEGQKVTVTVPVELEGEAPGEEEGGVVDQIRRELEMKVLPREIPNRLTVDISGLDVGDHISVGDIRGMLPESAELFDDDDRIVVTVSYPQAEVEEAEEEELLISELEEPEVIGRGGDEDEDEAADEDE